MISPAAISTAMDTPTRWQAHPTEAVVYLTVFSGKNGYTLGSYVLSLEGAVPRFGGGWDSRRLPATSVGDLNGDGADDLAYSDGYASTLLGYT